MTSPAALDTELTTYDQPGPFTYPVPWWCDEVDVILLDGGQGGDGGLAGDRGEGGQAGRFRAATLVRGVDFTGDTIPGNVGAGGTGGSTGNVQYARTDGEATTISTGSLPVQPATRQPGPETFNSGDSPGLLVFNGHTYEGGGQQNQPGGAGIAPGGGGAGSASGHSQGGDAAPGRAWFRARQTRYRSQAAYTATSDPTAFGQFAPHAGEETHVPGPGQHVYHIPWWCNAIDAVGISGAGGGQGAFLRLNPPERGGGGEPGNWVGRTLVRGRDIPWEQNTLVFTAGDGGTGGGQEQPGGDGQAYFLSGFREMHADGGVGEKGPGGAIDHTGHRAGTFRFNGRDYVGGGLQTDAGMDGLPDGGGGAGGGTQDTEFHDGGAGAPGAGWFFAYQTAGQRTASYRGLSQPTATAYNPNVPATARYIGTSQPTATARRGGQPAHYIATTAPYAVSHHLGEDQSRYRASWSPATNTPDLTPTPAGGPPYNFPLHEWSWVVELANPTVPENAPAGLPGIGGDPTALPDPIPPAVLHTGDIVEWDAIASTYRLIPASIDTFTANQNADQHLITNLADPRTGAPGLNDAANRSYVDTAIAESTLYQGRWEVAANNPDLTPIPDGTGIPPTGPPYSWPLNAYTWIAQTADPMVPEAAPATLPGIAGLMVNDGDNIIWIGAINEYVIDSGGLNQAQADLRYARLIGGFGNYTVDEDYPTGRILHYRGALYEVITAITDAPATPDPAKWQALTITDYVTGQNYPVGRILQWNNALYRVTTAIAAAPAVPVEANWVQMGVSQFDARYARLVGGFGAYTADEDYQVGRILHWNNMLWQVTTAITDAPATPNHSWWKPYGAEQTDYWQGAISADPNWTNGSWVTLVSSMPRYFVGDVTIAAATGANNTDATYKLHVATSYQAATVTVTAASVTVGCFDQFRVSAAGPTSPMRLEGRLATALTPAALKIHVQGTSQAEAVNSTTVPKPPVAARTSLGGNEYDLVTASDIPISANDGDLLYARLIGGFGVYTIGANYPVGRILQYDNLLFQVTTAITNAPATPDHSRWSPVINGLFDMWQGSPSSTSWGVNNWVHLATVPQWFVGELLVALAQGSVSSTYHLSITGTSGAGSLTVLNRSEQGAGAFNQFRLSSATGGAGDMRIEARIASAWSSGMNLKAVVRGFNNLVGSTATVPAPIAAAAANLGGTQYDLVASTETPITTVDGDARYAAIGRPIRTYTTSAAYAVGDLVAYDGVTFQVTTAIATAAASPDHSLWRPIGQSAQAFWQGVPAGGATWAAPNWVKLLDMSAYSQADISIELSANGMAYAYRLLYTSGLNNAALVLLSASGGGFNAFTEFRISAADTTGAGARRLYGKIGVSAATALKIVVNGVALATATAINTSAVTIPNPPTAIAGGDGGLPSTATEPEYARITVSTAGLLTQAAGDARYARLGAPIRTYTTAANYAVGDLLLYQDDVYRVTTAITNAPATPNDANWTSLTIGDYTTGASYPVNRILHWNNSLYRVTTAITNAPATPADANWVQISGTSSGTGSSSGYNAHDLISRHMPNYQRPSQGTSWNNANPPTMMRYRNGLVGVDGDFATQAFLPTSGTVGLPFFIRNESSNPTGFTITVGTARTDMAAALVINSNSTAVFVWNGTLWSYVGLVANTPAVNPIMGATRGQFGSGDGYADHNRWQILLGDASSNSGTASVFNPHYIASRHAVLGTETTPSPARDRGNTIDFWLNDGTKSPTSQAANVSTYWAGSFTPFGLSLPLGSAATPPLNFGDNIAGGDWDTGIYSPGDNQIGLATNGAARVRVDNNGLTTVAVPLRVDNGNNTGAALAAISFGLAATNPGTIDWPHHISTRHQSYATPTRATNNAIDFYINDGTQTPATITPATNCYWAGSFTGRGLSLPMGSAAQPSLNFGNNAAAGDNDTGLYSPADGQISFAINGVEEFRMGGTHGLGLINAPSTRSLLVQQDTNAAREQELLYCYSQTGNDAIIALHSRSTGNVVGGNHEGNWYAYQMSGGWGWQNWMRSTTASPGGVWFAGRCSAIAYDTRILAATTQEVSYDPLPSIIDCLPVATYRLREVECRTRDGQLIRNPPDPGHDVRKKRIGLIAEDLLRNRHTRDLVNNADKPDEMGVDLGQLMAVLVNEVKLLRKRVAQLEKRNR